MAKTAKPPATQDHLAIAQIRDGLVIMKNGTFRSIVAVSAVNFALKSQQEQDAIIYQFQSFINSLTSQIQIVAQSRQLDLNTYLNKMTQLAREQTNDLLRFQMADYIDFVGRLITLANIMEKRFYVVIPHDTLGSGSNGALGFLLGGRKTVPHYTEEQFARYKEELNERVNVMVSGLSSIGLRAVQLNTQELVEFFYGIYNPEEAAEEKLIDVDELRADIIQRAPGEQNGS